MGDALAILFCHHWGPASVSRCHLRRDDQDEFLVVFFVGDAWILYTMLFASPSNPVRIPPHYLNK